MRLCSIASGSSGNCIYLGNEQTHLLIDAGISGKRIENGMEKLDVKAEELDGILVTHEHSDHINGLGVMARRYGLPIYATSATICAIKKTKSLGYIPDECFFEILPEEKFFIKDIEVFPFSIYHDAAKPVAYRFNEEEKSIGILTDIGKYDEGIVDNLQGLDVLLLEANHDVRMLQVGSYPYYLKQRILGDYGHLSNESSGRLLNRLLHDHFKYVILGHLSRENNLAELAYETVRLEVDMADHEYKSADFRMMIANRDCVSDIVQI